MRQVEDVLFCLATLSGYLDNFVSVDAGGAGGRAAVLATLV